MHLSQGAPELVLHTGSPLQRDTIKGEAPPRGWLKTVPSLLVSPEGKSKQQRPHKIQKTKGPLWKRLGAPLPWVSSSETRGPRAKGRRNHNRGDGWIFYIFLQVIKKEKNGCDIVKKGLPFCLCRTEQTSTGALRTQLGKLCKQCNCGLQSYSLDLFVLFCNYGCATMDMSTIVWVWYDMSCIV